MKLSEAGCLGCPSDSRIQCKRLVTWSLGVWNPRNLGQEGMELQNEWEGHSGQEEVERFGEGSSTT